MNLSWVKITGILKDCRTNSRAPEQDIQQKRSALSLLNTKTTEFIPTKKQQSFLVWSNTVWKMRLQIFRMPKSP
jgi:hypothetical protein